MVIMAAKIRSRTLLRLEPEAPRASLPSQSCIQHNCPPAHTRTRCVSPAWTHMSLCANTLLQLELPKLALGLLELPKPALISSPQTLPSGTAPCREMRLHL